MCLRRRSRLSRSTRRRINGVPGRKASYGEGCLREAVFTVDRLISVRRDLYYIGTQRALRLFTDRQNCAAFYFNRKTNLDHCISQRNPAVHDRFRVLPLQYGESGSGAQFSFVIQRGFNGTVAPVATGTSDCFPSAAGSLPLCPALPRKEQVRYDGLGLNSAGRLQQPFRETCGAAPRQGRDAVVGAPRRFAPVPGALDQPAILDSLFRPVTLPGMGIAISPRGDMLKNCVPVYPRTHRVGNQLNFR